jgi:hypothetical protein
LRYTVGLENCHDTLTPFRVRKSDDCTVSNLLHRGKYAFNWFWPDVLATGDDEISSATGNV